MPRHVNRAKMTTTTTGTGTITLGSASSGYLSFASAGVNDGEVVPYILVDANGTAWEIGWGTYTSSGTTLARTTILQSTNSNNAISLSAGTHTVMIGPIAQSIPWGGGAMGATLGNYHIAGISSAAVADQTSVANVLVMSPIMVAQRTAFTKLGVKTGASHSSTTGCRLGIWYNRTTVDLPGKLLVAPTALSLTGASTNFESTLTGYLNPGLYWLGVVCNGTGTSLVSHNTGTLNGIFGYNSSASAYSRLQRSFTYAALGDEGGSSFTLDNTAFNPAVYLKV